MARVIVVENDRIAARDLAEILVELGHDCPGRAGRYEDAVALVKEYEPDLALIDIQLDGSRDGIALAGELREEHDLALAFITSHADHATVQQASAMRPNGYLIKPFDVPSVDALVSTALANHATSGQTIDCEALIGGPEVSGAGLSRGQQSLLERHVAKYLDTAIRNEDLASLLDLGSAAFARRFQVSFAMTPHQYVVAQRLAEAKRLLRNTRWPISEVALSVGFASQAHFTTAFKKANGVTPRQYRRATR